MTTFMALRLTVLGIGAMLASILPACDGGQFGPIDIAYCDATMPEDTAKPNLLVIGDSISIGYLTTLADALPDFDVVHNPCNARSSRNGVLNIDSWLAKREQWDLVVFNFGLWDSIRYIQMTRDQYASNLRYIGEKILSKAPQAIFLTTTVIPENEPTRRIGFEGELNEVAYEVMGDLGIPVYDLNAESRLIPHLRMFPEKRADVHYSAEGYEILGQFVAEAIRLNTINSTP